MNDIVFAAFLDELRLIKEAQLEKDSDLRATVQFVKNRARKLVSSRAPTQLAPTQTGSSSPPALGRAVDYLTGYYPGAPARIGGLPASMRPPRLVPISEAARETEEYLKRMAKRFPDPQTVPMTGRPLGQRINLITPDLQQAARLQGALRSGNLTPVQAVL